ncbi:hypothetical protein IFR04_009279 [Cadophora malorum]|uniref:F-box domain-containing protein n=1 Tax=Cadophora malorum TaxID=108018 RepID=A0A8H7TCX4_9HELO|nr:hypothetical protein IFR04_009279 [Cadophora malorum]
MTEYFTTIFPQVNDYILGPPPTAASFLYEAMTVLLDLPREMILHITHFLSPASAASFTHCCRAVLKIIGTKYWQALIDSSQKQGLRQFLRLLEIDLSNHVLCSHCSILHEIDSSTHRSKECYPSELFGGVYIYIHKDIIFLSIAAMMKLYRQGLDYSQFLRYFTCRFTGTRESIPYQFLSRAKIINGSLLLRVQESFLFPKGHQPQIPITARVGICHHVGIPGFTFDARLPEHAQCTLDHDHEARQCSRSSGMRQCVYCPTEFQIELQGCADLGVALVTTKWLDLGEGRTVLDPKWWSRLSTKYTNHELFSGMRGIYKQEIEDRKPIQSELASIRDAMESEEDLESDVAEAKSRLGLCIRLIDSRLGLGY